MKSTNCKKCKDGKNNRGRWTNHPASQWWQTLQLFRSNKLRYHSLFRLYIHDYLEAKHCVFKHLFCLYNTAKHGQRAGRLLLLDTLFALSNREGHFAWSLIFPPCITGVFYFWDCSTCICIGVKITIQQLCSPWFKKKKKFIVQCPGKADTKTVSPSTKTVLAITMVGWGGGSCVIESKESF